MQNISPPPPPSYCDSLALLGSSASARARQPGTKRRRARKHISQARSRRQRARASCRPLPAGCWLRRDKIRSTRLQGSSAGPAGWVLRARALKVPIVCTCCALAQVRAGRLAGLASAHTHARARTGETLRAGSLTGCARDFARLERAASPARLSACGPTQSGPQRAPVRAQSGKLAHALGPIGAPTAALSKWAPAFAPV